MNKRILGVSAASAVLAAMPLLGVFADDQKVTDTVTVNVLPSCTLGEEANGASPNETIANRTTNKEMKGSAFSITCNNGAWELKAVGGQDDQISTDMKDSASHTIPSANGTLDGKTSNWAFKATGEHVETDYKEWSAIPGTATKIAGNTADAGAESVEITYGVSVGPNQNQGTYVGHVTYTLAQTN